MGKGPCRPLELRSSGSWQSGLNCTATYHPRGDNIPVKVTPSDVDDSVPTEDKIAEAVKKLRRNRSGGAPGIRAEHLKGWLAAANRRKMAEEKGEEKTEAEEEGGDLWGKLVELTQTTFR